MADRFDPDAGRLRGNPTFCWRVDGGWEVGLELLLPDRLTGEFVVYGGSGSGATRQEAARRAAAQAEADAFENNGQLRYKVHRLRNRDLAIPLPPEEELGG